MQESEFKQELSRYLQFLVAKYDELDDKSEVEDLILELNKLSKNNKGIIPRSFKTKLERFSKKCMIKHSKPNKNNKQKEIVKKTPKKASRQDSSAKKRQNKNINETKNKEKELNLKEISDFMAIIQNDPELLQEYEELVNEYEEARSEIKAKTLMKFKSLQSPTKVDTNIAIVLLYFLWQIDNSILLRNDK